MLLRKHNAACIAAFSGLLITPGVWAADTLADAFTGGKASGNLQYRYERVSQVGTLLPANASTVRLQFGFETATFNGVGAMVEVETLKALNNNYNSTANGKTAYAVVADPEATEMNQAYVSYSGMADTTMKWGRQRIKLDNERFVGNAGWRQNEQTFDAFTLTSKSLPDATVTAGYITNVNRVFSDQAIAAAGAAAGNHKMRSKLLNANYKGWGFGELSGYVYLLNYDTATAFTGFSTKTYGLRLKGIAPAFGNSLLYTAEYASQSEGSGNPVKFKASYTLLEGGIDIFSAVFKLGYEVLGSDAGATGAATLKSFSAPLGSLHAFNGWADMFLATPAQGLKDTYASANTKLAGINLGAVYHNYSADKTTAALSSSGIGNEWNFVATKVFDANYTIGLKYANYQAKGTTATTFATNVNTKKAWLWGAFKF